VRLTDLKGSRLKQWKQEQGEYPIADLPSGFYILSWKSENLFGNQILIKN